MDFKHKKLYRSPKDGIITGMAAGVGHYFEVDPVFVRLIWMALTVVTNVWPMVVLYVALYFIVPVDPAQASVPQHQEPKDVTPPVQHMDSNQNM